MTRRRFNVTGICRPDRDYMLSPLQRLPQIRGLIDSQAYFVLHAPRQTGKTTSLLAAAQALTHQGSYVAALLSMESGAPYLDDVATAEGAILANWRASLIEQLPAELLPPPWPDSAPGSRIRTALSTWTKAAPRPLVVFLDEIDALHDAALVTVLRQLREGFNWRPGGFPWALALCGVRDVRDYRIGGEHGGRSHGASPFNIKQESLTLRSFTAQEVAELLGQHTADTGQIFGKGVPEQIYHLTCGQPWLVNALARQLTEVVVPDPALAITIGAIETAKEILIQRRDTHLDSLADKLHEDRVRRIIEPILAGTQVQLDTLNDDLLYVRDLGLVAPDAPVRIANPLYQEVIPRSLSFLAQEYLDQQAAWYLRDDGSLDMVLLLASFQEFFAEHGEAWLGRFDYKEAGPHLLLMAFLQRIVNGGGRITREFAAGSGRADVVVEYGRRRAVIELKLRRSERTLQEGLVQLGGYLSRLGEVEGHLVIFDRRAKVPWSERLFLREEATPLGQRVYVFGA